MLITKDCDNCWFGVNRICPAFFHADEMKCLNYSLWEPIRVKPIDRKEVSKPKTYVQLEECDT